ncbi:MAG: hypothetical protein PHC66_02090 [Candidatus Nanoarchaeia archaeon]|nr:hypothetical protein [Candidatus Nanoarchaeia archaeon]MDD5239734.1 hypothetical protein [Candidatus Nanoarchaeia archaeon]
MKYMEYVKQFFAGAVFPAVAYAALIGLSNIYGPLYSIVNLWWVPLFAGLWNVVYFFRVKNGLCLFSDWNLKLLANGAAFGQVVAIASIWVNQFSGIDLAIRILVFPLIGAFVWRYVTAYFNKELGLKEK